MIKDMWLSRGAKFDNDVIVSKLISKGQNWQIVLSTFDMYVLLVKPDLFFKWVSKEFIPDTLFKCVVYNNNEYYVYYSKSDYIISSIEYGPYPDNSLSARVFAIALKETRNINKEISLHDAIFIEQISRLLPTFTVSESCNDDLVLGKWLSGGVNISIKSTNRLCNLLNWMNKSVVLSIIEEAGIQTGLSEQPDRNDIEKDNGNEQGFVLKGRTELAKFFNEHIVDIVRNNEKYKRMGINFPSAIILHGPPGCGKTFAVEKLINFLDWPSFYISSATIGSPYIHDTSKKISEMFDNAIEQSPSVLVIDEMDAFLTSRNAEKASALYHTEEVAEFLRRIPDAANKNVLVIGMTNMIDTIDPAILRRGRFDHVLEVKMPSVIEIEELLAGILDNIPHEESININDIAVKLQKRPLSDVSFAIKEACFYAVKNDINYLNNDIILNAIKQLPPIKDGEIKIGFGIN
jgi:hypothetical protein